MNLHDSCLNSISITFSYLNVLIFTCSSAKDDEEINSEDDMETGGEGQEEEQEAVRNGPPKRKLEMAEYPNFMAKRFAAFLPYRDATLQKWYDKTRLTTGKSKKVTKKNLPKRVKAVLAAKGFKINAYVFRRPCWCNGQVSQLNIIYYIILILIVYTYVFLNVTQLDTAVTALHVNIFANLLSLCISHQTGFWSIWQEHPHTGGAGFNGQREAGETYTDAQVWIQSSGEAGAHHAWNRQRRHRGRGKTPLSF